MKTLAQQALDYLQTGSRVILNQATEVQFFTRETIYDFADNSRLYLKMYGTSYATGEPK